MHLTQSIAHSREVLPLIYIPTLGCLRQGLTMSKELQAWGTTPSTNSSMKVILTSSFSSIPLLRIGLEHRSRSLAQDSEAGRFSTWRGVGDFE